MKRGLGRPTQGLTNNSLSAELGKGDSLTRFAKQALDDWHENIAAPGTISRNRRREEICILARESFIDPRVMLAVVLLKKRQYRNHNQPHEIS